MCPNLEHVKCVIRKVQVLNAYGFVQFQWLNTNSSSIYLYLGKLGKLAKPTKKSFEKPIKYEPDPVPLQFVDGKRYCFPS